jgi:hypothetical protein
LQYVLQCNILSFVSVPPLPSGLKTRECGSFTLKEVTDVQRFLHSVRDEAFQSVYESNNDNRRLSTFGKWTDSIEELEKSWVEEAQIVHDTPSLHDMARDGKCHEAVMWYTHHLSESTKEEAKLHLALPLLPNVQHLVNKNLHVEGSSHDKVFKGYKQGLGCTKCHAGGQAAKNKEFVEWPQEVEYRARGFGAFPFWDNEGPGCTTCGKNILPGTDVHVKFSAKLDSENLMHGNCSMTWVKHAGAPHFQPCNHLFVKGKGAFIYTPKVNQETEADGKFCCRTYRATDTQVLTPPAGMLFIL